MNATKVIEVVVYIHGVSPGIKESNHDAEYRKLHCGIRKEAKGWPDTFCGVEWGWDYDDDKIRETHESLTKAQEKLGQPLMSAIPKSSNPLLGKLLDDLRPLMFYGFGDMFYYVSSDGKQAIRDAVAEQIIEHIKCTVKDCDLLSLTILGHSAGSVIGFDFLFYLFSCHRKAEDYCANDRTSKEMANLEDRVKRGALRVRRFITFGSPISLVACRSDAVLEILAAGRKLDATDYGLTRDFSKVKSKIRQPRWINLRDEDDLISWPIEPLMSSPGPSAVKDIDINVSSDPFEVHNSYWGSKKVHCKIARRW